MHHEVTDEHGDVVKGDDDRPLYYDDKDGDDRNNQTVYDSDGHKVDAHYDAQTGEVGERAPVHWW